MTEVNYLSESWVMNAKAFIIFQFQFISLLQFVTLSFLIVVKRLTEPVTNVITASFPGIHSTGFIYNVENNLSLPFNFNSFNNSFLSSGSNIY